jgi:hypothetical protein
MTPKISSLLVTCARNRGAIVGTASVVSSYFRALVITTATTEIINHAPTESVFQEPIQISNPLQSSTPDALQVNSAALLI